MKIETIGFIGGGRITRIFLQAFANSNCNFKQITVLDPNPETLAKLKSFFPPIATISDIDSFESSDIVFLAVHPPVIMESLTKIGAGLKKTTMVVSLAPKITLKTMQSALPGNPALARMNPSAASIVGQGYNPVALADTFGESDREALFSLLKPLGKNFQVDESKIEAYAVIGAMGLTYLWFQLQQLKTLGVTFGLSEADAAMTLSNMVQGAASTLFESGMTPTEVMDLVPVKPLGEHEEMIKALYNEKLTAIFNKIKP